MGFLPSALRHSIVCQANITFVVFTCLMPQKKPPILVINPDDGPVP